MLARLDAARGTRRVAGAAAAPLLDEMSQARAGARAARAGRPRDPGEPAAHGAGARRVLPRQHRSAPSSRRSARTASRSAARSRSWGSTTPSACSASARSRSRPTRIRRRPVIERRPRAARGIAVGAGLLHRGGRAAAARPRASDRAAAREAPGRGAGATTVPTRATRSRPPVAGAARGAARRSSPKCAAPRPTPRRATSCRAKLDDLRNDAELIGDAELVAQAAAALAEFDAGGTAALAAAVTAIAESAGAAPAPAISEETQRLLATDATELDAELLDIYLTEAHEVLDTIAAQRAMLEENHGDREALRTVRRQFHTLKGSGRMVGLTDLGEIAFEVEKIHNRLLEEERVGDARGAGDDRRGRAEFPRVGRRAVGVGPRERRPGARCTRRSPPSRRRCRRAAMRRSSPGPPPSRTPEPVLEIVPPLPPAPEFLPPVSSSGARFGAGHRNAADRVARGRRSAVRWSRPSPRSRCRRHRPPRRSRRHRSTTSRSTSRRRHRSTTSRSKSRRRRIVDDERGRPTRSSSATSRCRPSCSAS